MAAVSNNSVALGYASHRLRNDPAVVAMSIHNIHNEYPVHRHAVLVGIQFKRRLHKVAERMKKSTYASFGALTDELSIHQFASTLRETTWQTILCVKFLVDGEDLLLKTMLDYLDVGADLEFSRDLEYTAPVIVACAERNIPVDLPTNTSHPDGPLFAAPKKDCKHCRRQVLK